MKIYQTYKHQKIEELKDKINMLVNDELYYSKGLFVDEVQTLLNELEREFNSLKNSNEDNVCRCMR